MDQFKDYLSFQRDKWKSEQQKAAVKEAFFAAIQNKKSPGVIVLELDFKLADPEWIWAGFRGEVADKTFIQIKNIQILSVYTGSKLVHSWTSPCTRIELKWFGP